MTVKLNSNGDVAERDPLREITGFYGHGRVLAFEMCVIDLAEANGLSMLELNQACHFLALATALRIAQKSKGLEGSGALEAMREMGLLDDYPLDGIMREELDTGVEMPGGRPEEPANPLERAAKGAVRGGRPSTTSFPAHRGRSKGATARDTKAPKGIPKPVL